MKNFLENNYKWIVIITSLFWLFFIYKLFMFWANFVCSSGGFIDICVIPNFEYSWTNAGYISILLFIISVILIIKLRKIQDKITKIKLSIIVLLLWFIGFPLFYIISPDFYFYRFWEYSYTDRDWNLTNMDLYLEKMWKYCDDSIDDFRFRRLYRRDLCEWQYVINFKTAEEYWIAFDYANKKNMWYMYYLTYKWAENFWLEKIVEKYNDVTFYWRILIWNWSNENYLNIMSEKTNNQKFLTLINYIKTKLEEWTKLNFKNNDESQLYWWNLDNEIRETLEKITEINYKIYYY